jgi:hypothetical protein
MPFAKTVNGQPLTSTEAIESAAAAGNLALINLGPGAVIVGSISGSSEEVPLFAQRPTTSQASHQSTKGNQT